MFEQRIQGGLAQGGELLGILPHAFHKAHGFTEQILAAAVFGLIRERAGIQRQILDPDARRIGAEMEQALLQVGADGGIAQWFIQHGAPAEAHAGHKGFAAGVQLAGLVLQQAGEVFFQLIKAVHAVERQIVALPFHRPEAQKFACALPAPAVGAGRDQQAAARAGFVDVQALGVAAVGNEAVPLPLAALMNMAQRPGVKPAAAQIVERAGGIAVGRVFAFHGTVQDAQLKDLLRIVAPEELGQIAAFAGTGMADAVDHGNGLPVPFQHMALHIRAEDGHVVRPVYGRETGGKRIVIAVGHEDPDAEGLQAAAAVPQGKLGLGAVVFLIVDVARQHEEVGAFFLTETKKALKGGEGGLLHEPREMPVLGGLPGQPLKGGVQMQVSRVNVPHDVHALPRRNGMEGEAKL